MDKSGAEGDSEEAEFMHYRDYLGFRMQGIEFNMGGP